MMEAWKLRPGQGIDSLELVKTEKEPLKHAEVRVSIKANSINARDMMVAMGQSPMPVAEELTPLSDGAGLVTEVGDGVTRVAPGDRVVIAFNPAHQTGLFEAWMGASALGELRTGLLSRETVIEEMALVKLPQNVSYEQAACLPCVGVTAWNALFEIDQFMPGQTVLSTGTGMLSLMALQLAKAAGARVGITSSNDQKLEQVRSLGADFTINYRANPEWDHAVREATHGAGADIVLETAGPPSIATSVKAAAHGGRVMQIGLKEMEGPPISPLDLLVNSVKIYPVMVGSRAMLERLVTYVSNNELTMPISGEFKFEEAPEAFNFFASGGSFGKVVISTN
ncbi:MAG: NAD(P)-dependent alcohol dehydrogenase [Pseudomonadota bacterium]